LCNKNLEVTLCKDYLTKAFTNKIILLFGLPDFVLTSGFFGTNDGNIAVFAIDESVQNQQPNIDAKSVYPTKTAVLGNSVKNLVILISDEAHHGNGEPEEARFIDQSNASSTNNADTVGIYMVPTKKADEYISRFKDRGFSIDSTYSFKDVRGLARGTNSEQTLVVWTAGPDMGVGNVISAPKEMAPTLPYK
jgi:hypothetical protein